MACGIPIRQIRNIVSPWKSRPSHVQRKPSVFFSARMTTTVSKPALQPITVPSAIPSTPIPPNGLGPNTSKTLVPMLTRFTTTIARNGVFVSPEPRKAAFTANIAPATGPDQANIRMYASA